jgi:hypothetical protein
MPSTTARDTSTYETMPDIATRDRTKIWKVLLRMIDLSGLVYRDNIIIAYLLLNIKHTYFGTLLT